MLAQLLLPWTTLRFGALTEAPGSGRVATSVAPGQPLTLNRDDAALVVVEALARAELAQLAVPVIDGDRAVADALAAVEPHALPPAAQPAARRDASLGAAQSDNPPDDPGMIAPDAVPLDADVEWEGDGPVAPEPLGNDDPAPGIP